MSTLNNQIKEQLLKRLVIDNPWWVNGHIAEDYNNMPERPYINQFYPLVDDLSIRRAVILMGPRRVGKTVMIYHSIERLIKSGVDPQKIIYLSIDTPIYNNVSLEELFNYALSALKKEGEYNDYYIFYDEIQYLKDWEVHLKSLVDSFRRSKFIASGSAAAALKMKSNESGAGRFTDFMLPPLTFYEYLTILQKENLIVINNSCDGIAYDTVDIDKLNRLFIEYINYGGYPEVVFSSKIRENPTQYIKNDIIDKVLLRDLPSLYGITDIQELNKLFMHIAFRSGQEFTYEKLSSESGIKKDTMKKYLEYLSAAFLIKVVNKIDQRAKLYKRVTSFKIYLTNPTLHCALFSAVDEGNEMIGALVETAIFAQWVQSDKSGYYYANWNIGKEKGEVDLVWLDTASQTAYSAAEIKWSDRYFDHPMELKSLEKFLTQNRNVTKIIVTSKSKRGTKECSFGNLIFVPSAIYAYWISDFDYRQKQKKVTERTK
ncbi:MAG: ATP-binding protein [Rikenellaceae bacterium]